jgi:hypothetical protein
MSDTLSDLKAELDALEREATELLESSMSPEWKRKHLALLFKKYIRAKKKYQDLLRAYAQRARGKKQEETESIIIDLLTSPEFSLLSAMMFTLFLHQLYRMDISSKPDFPLPPIPESLVAEATIIVPKP